MSNPENNISKEELITELQLELRYHEDGGTGYRQETTRLALQVANSLPDTNIFFDRSQTLQVVRTFVKDVDEYRLLDIAKMLSVITKDLYRKKNMSDEMKAYLLEKRKSRKPLGFIEKENS